MKEPLQAALKPGQRRQQTAGGLQRMVFGVFAAALLGEAVALGRNVFGLPVTWAVSLAVLTAGPVLGLLLGLLLRRPWHDAAAAGDDHYGLKDRSVTALAFADNAGRTRLHDLQIAMRSITWGA
jgi:hypothetical protein